MMDSALRKLQDKLQQSFKRVGGGSKFFGGVKRGEAAELSADLNSTDKERQKNAVKRVIANMTLGRDVSQLFTDVVKLGQTLNLELKKLVYLYILNTAKLQQEKALMAVNTFLQDALHQSPIIRALAIRTMMCIRIASVTEYTIEPLRRAAKDTDPYVRKTAAMGLGKLYHQHPVLFMELGLLEDLFHLLADNFSVVAANAAAVIAEIVGAGRQPAAAIKHDSVNRVLNSLTDATEWAQCYYLDLLGAYQPSSPTECENIVDRIVARLGHTNPSVVLGTVKVLARLLPQCGGDALTQYLPRINAALLTLIKAEPEIQFVACKNIQLLLRLFPTLLRNNVDAFFIRFTDPPYVKAEKLSLLLRLTTQTNAPRVIKELVEYSAEVDVLFVRSVVHALAATAIKVESVAPEVVQQLLMLAEKRRELLPDVVNAAKNILRKYPDLCLDLAAPLLEQHGAEDVAQEEAKVSLVWMLGEFCDVLQDGARILKDLLESFLIQELAVQLALLTAVVKVFLRNPAAMETTLTSVLELITQGSDNADLRDRAYVYWRLLAEGVGVEAMKGIVHGRQAPTVDTDALPEQLRAMGDAEVAAILNTAAAVFGKPARTFVAEYGLHDDAVEDDDDEDEDETATATDGPATPATTTSASPAGSNAATAPPAAAGAAAATKRVDPFDELFSGGGSSSSRAVAPPTAVAGGGSHQSVPAGDPFDPFAPTPVHSSSPSAPPPSLPTSTFTAPITKPSATFDDIFGPSPPAASGAAPSHQQQPVSLPQVVDPAQGNGLRIHAAVRLGDETRESFVELRLQNTSGSAISDFVMQLNRNAFGVVPTTPIAECMAASTIAPGAAADVRVPIRVSHTHFDPQKLVVEAGLKSSAGLALFSLPVDPHDFLLPTPIITRAEFVAKWAGVDSINEVKVHLPCVAKLAGRPVESVTALLSSFKISVVTGRSSAQVDAFYATAKTHLSITALVELIANKESPSTSTLTVKSLRAADIVPAVMQVLLAALQ